MTTTAPTDRDYSENDGRQTERRRRQIVLDEYGVGHDLGYPDDGEDDAAAAADRSDDWEQQIERETEYDPFDVYGGGESVDEEQPRQGGRGGDQAHQRGRSEQEEDSDDEIPIAQSPRPRIVLRPGPTAAPPPPPEPVEEDGDDERPIRFSQTVARRLGSTAPASAPPPQPSSSCSDSSSSVIRDATVENNGAIDCVICFLPLKPPIFQCNVGHVVCSRCSERQGQASKCHECRAPTPGGYTRCHAMEKVIDAIRVPCRHAAHGCAARPPYHARDAHALSCPHAPCHCPGCAFAGSPAALADHLAGAAHNWPCTAVGGGGGGTNVFLRDGFNFIATRDKFLFLLDLRKAPPFGRAVAAFCVHPDRAAAATLKLTHRGCPSMHGMCEMFLQSAEFKVACTDLADGVPDPSSSNCFQFVVPGSVREDDDGASTRVIVEITPQRPSS